MTLTGTGMVIGTPAYMSPEQAKGLKGAELDGRSDLYSLGVVMYQMLTGDLPLKADSTLELLMAHISTPPKPIREGRPDLNIPDSVAAVVMRCLEKNRELRPASGQALIDEIEVAADRGPELLAKPSAASTLKEVAPQRTVELPVSPTIVPQSRCRISRSWFWALTAVLIAGALGGPWYLRVRKPSAEHEGPRVASTSVEHPPDTTSRVTDSPPAPERQSVAIEPVKTAESLVPSAAPKAFPIYQKRERGPSADHSTQESNETRPDRKAAAESSPGASSPNTGLTLPQSAAQAPVNPPMNPPTTATTISPPASGSLEIETQPGSGGARVYVDDQLKDTASLKGSLIPPDLSLNPTSSVPTNQRLRKFTVSRFHGMIPTPGVLTIGVGMVEFRSFNHKDVVSLRFDELAKVERAHRQLVQPVLRIETKDHKSYTFWTNGQEDPRILVDAILASMGNK
jgi:serine/threonine protein kinase